MRLLAFYKPKSKPLTRRPRLSRRKWELSATFENNKIVVPAGTLIGSGNNQADPLDTNVVLTLEGNTFTAPAFSIGGWVNVLSYSAVNPNL